MVSVHLARQPIFDRSNAVVGYELLFRDAGGAGWSGAEAATTNVILHALTEFGLERAAGGRFAWINASREFLLSGLARTLPAASVGLEILEGQRVDAELVAAVAELRADGYRFALDDFAFGDEAEQLLELAEIVKLDLRALGETGFAEHVHRLTSRGIPVLAEKVETPEEHALAAELGCARFQGFFYCRPQLLSRRRIGADEVALLRLLTALQRPDLELSEVVELVSQDVGLGVRLLRYLNSAYLGLGHTVSSLHQAVTLLGLEGLRRWATLSAYAGLAGGRSELARTALVRARTCELLADSPEGRGGCFTLGLFSIVDALTGLPMREALRSMPFSEEMHAALVDGTGELGTLLESVLSLEGGDFAHAHRLRPGCADAYLEALVWADETSAAFADDALAVAS